MLIAKYLIAKNYKLPKFLIIWEVQEKLGISSISREILYR